MKMARIFQKIPLKRRQYDAVQMSQAYHAITERKMSIYKASKEYGVPESTLRDRIKDRIPFDEDVLPKLGQTLLDEKEQLTLAEHFNHMSYLGYGYIAKDMKMIACDYAISLNKKDPLKTDLSSSWFYEFKKKFPYVIPKKHCAKLSVERSNATSAGTVQIYYTNLKAVLDTTDHEPDQLYIVDEITLPMEQYAEDVYLRTNSSERAASDGETKSFTLFGCANARGSLVPPYLVLPGKKWNDSYLEGTCAGSDGECSEDGDTNALVLSNYFDNHFRKFVPFGKDNKPVIVLYDGQKLNLMLTLKSFGEDNNILFFVLPPHASCITGLKLGCFQPISEVFKKGSQLYLRKKNCLSLENAEVGRLASKSYLKTMTPDTLTSFFKSIGVYPLDSSVVRASELEDKAVDFTGFLEKNEVSEISNDEDEDA